MKRAFVLSICLLTAVVGMMAQTQNKFWRTTISTTGLYGACDEKGNSTIPNVFQRMGFWGTNAVSFIEYDSRFFVIDRKGEMVGGESWDEEPVIFDRFVMAGNKDERFLMDLHGNRLPVEGTEVTLMKGWNWVADNLMLHSKAADSTYQLHGIDGTLVVNECSTIELLNRLPLVKYLRKGTWGVCNLAGTEVVPCQYSKIEEVNEQKHDPIQKPAHQNDEQSKPEQIPQHAERKQLRYVIQDKLAAILDWIHNRVDQ